MKNKRKKKLSMFRFLSELIVLQLTQFYNRRYVMDGPKKFGIQRDKFFFFFFFLYSMCIFNYIGVKHFRTDVFYLYQCHIVWRHVGQSVCLWAGTWARWGRALEDNSHPWIVSLLPHVPVCDGPGVLQS